MDESNDKYPVSLDIDYPKSLSRLSTVFRIILIIPIAIIGILLMDSGVVGIIFIPVILMILFRQKYPKWWFDWNVSLVKFHIRIWSYLLLLREEYPSTDEEQAIHINIKYPDVENDLYRGLPLVKWFLAIPHFIIIKILFIGQCVCTIIAWFSILFTATYPRALFDFVVGVNRWSLRILAYAIILTTDRYPPFRLSN